MAKAKRSQKTNAKLLDDCATLLQRIVRMKAAIHGKSPIITCVTCGAKKHWKEMHGGHWISRTWSKHKVCEENIHPQCPGCNTFKPERVADDYTLYMINMYGKDWVEEMITSKREVCKRPRADILELKQELKDRAKELEAIVPL